jgi:addiction module HigA family antidote
MKKPKLLPNIHPGEILLEDFLKPMGVSQYRLAQDTGLPHSRITRIVRGQNGISVDTDARFALFFGTSRGFWIRLQEAYDMLEFDRHQAKRVKTEVRPLALAS